MEKKVLEFYDHNFTIVNNELKMFIENSNMLVIQSYINLTEATFIEIKNIFGSLTYIG